MNTTNQEPERERKTFITEVKYLMTQNKIKPFPSVDMLSNETLKEILQDYNNTKLSGVNKTILSGIVKAAGAFAIRTETLTEETVEVITNEFLDNEDVVGCTTTVIGFITPNIPMIGILTGAIIAGKFLFDGILKARKETAPTQSETKPNPEPVFHESKEGF